MYSKEHIAEKLKMCWYNFSPYFTWIFLCL